MLGMECGDLSTLWKRRLVGALQKIPDLPEFDLETNRMALILEGGCRVSDMHDGGPNAEGSLRIWNQVGRQTGAQAISLRIMEFAPGLSPGIRNGDCDEILYVLDWERGWERGHPDSERGHPVRLSEQRER